jgi:hypothetical protein
VLFRSVYYHGTKVNFNWTHEYTQQESGDTLTHTFIFTIPYYNRTYWWYARGTVDGKPSSSRSPFFSYYVTIIPGPEILLASQESCVANYLWFYSEAIGGPLFSTPSTKYLLTKLILKLERASEPGDFIASLRETENNLPVGSDLCSVTIPGDQILQGFPCDDAHKVIFNFEDQGFELKESTIYAMLGRSPSGWNIKAGLYQYTGIQKVWSWDNGANWVLSTGNIPWFEIYGKEIG